jgi:transposase-like protein
MLLVSENTKGGHMQSGSQKPASSRKADFWSGHILNWKQTNLNKAEYCRHNGLSRHAFSYWCKKLESSQSPETDNAIVPLALKVQDLDTSSEVPLSLRIGRRFQVDIRADFNATVLQKLIKTLEAMA